MPAHDNPFEPSPTQLAPVECRHPCLQIATAILLGFLVVAAPSGCSCWKDPLGKKKAETAEELEKKKKELQEKKKKKPDFEIEKISVLPYDDNSTRNLIKPGHWFSVQQTMKANNYDFPVGRLDAGCVTRTGQPLYLNRSPFSLRATRPVSLPKGTLKHFDITFFAARPENESRALWIQTVLRPRGGGREVWPPAMEPTTRLKAHQFYLVVLAGLPDSYGFLKALKSVDPPRSEWDMNGLDTDYVVVLPKGTRRIDLPSHPLTWSSTAYVVWDDFDPAILSIDQQSALVDWLHWGGQLIISGPRTLDSLAEQPFRGVPAGAGGSAGKLDDQVVEELNKHWRVHEKRDFELVIDPEKRPEIVELKKAPEADYVPNTGKLIVERRVGRGRIVASAVALNHPALTKWRAYDNLFNACILRRPPRIYSENSDLEIVEKWVDAGTDREDSRLTSKLRYFSRDAHPAGYAPNVDTDAVRVVRDRNGIIERRTFLNRSANESRLAGMDVVGFNSESDSGVAGWNDFSEASVAARRSLERAAGISVPESGFIARMLGLYLLILVPLNWGLFRLLGRVEWAWVAVPIISVFGAVAVVRVAQLDIGFARSRTEIAIVETQPGYSRGHVTRYFGLYTSLSTTYEVACDEPSSLVQPFSTNQPLDPLRSDRQIVSIHRDKNTRLSGFSVLSNSTGMVHSEQLLDLGGTISLAGADGSYRVDNQTDHDVREAAIVRRISKEGFEVAWVGDLKSKTAVPVTFSPLIDQRVDFPQWQENPTTSLIVPPDEVSLRELIDLAVDPERLGIGGVVLAGWTDQPMPGVTIRPAASQAMYRTMIVANLRYPTLIPSESDANTYWELAKNRPDPAGEAWDEITN